RQPRTELAPRVRTREVDLLTQPPVTQDDHRAARLHPPHLRFAPWAFGHEERVPRLVAGAPESAQRLDSVLPPVRRVGATHPQAEAERRMSEGLGPAPP